MPLIYEPEYGEGEKRHHSCDPPGCNLYIGVMWADCGSRGTIWKCDVCGKYWYIKRYYSGTERNIWKRVWPWHLNIWRQIWKMKNNASNL